MTDKEWLKIISFLLDALEQEHIGLKNNYIIILEEEFGVKIDEQLTTNY